MGNTGNTILSFCPQETVINKTDLILLQEVQIQNQMLALGRSCIYRVKQLPDQLVIQATRNFRANSSIMLDDYLTIAKVVTQRIAHQNIAKMHLTNIHSSPHKYQTHLSITSYAHYFALTLDQAISHRKIKKQPFSSQEIWYLINTLIDVSLYLKHKNIYFGVYVVKNIYLSQEGHIKIYLFHVEPNHSHFLYFHLLNNRQKTQNFLPIPPEYLSLLKQNMKQMKYTNVQKLDVFGIGMIAIQAMLLNPKTNYYSNLQLSTFAFQQHLLKKDIQLLRTIYPEELIFMIENLLMVKPKDRFSLQLAQNYINSICRQIAVSSQIKMAQCDDIPFYEKQSFQSEFNICRSATNNRRADTKRKQKVAAINQQQRQGKPSLNGIKMITQMTQTKQNVSHQDINERKRKAKSNLLDKNILRFC